MKIKQILKDFTNFDKRDIRIFKIMGYTLLTYIGMSILNFGLKSLNIITKDVYTITQEILFYMANIPVIILIINLVNPLKSFKDLSKKKKDL